MSDPSPDLRDRGKRAVRLALVFTALSLFLAIVLLIKETAYTFVAFMFLGPVLLLLAALALGWVIFQELRSKKVL